MAERALKISIIASDLSSSGAGRWQGAVRPFLLAQAFQRLGHSVEILGFADQAGGLPSAENLPIKVIPNADYPQFFGAARSLMSQIEGDVVVAYKPKPSSFGLALFYRLLYRLRKKCPVILDIDDWELSWHGGDSYRYGGSVWQLGRDILNPSGALRSPDNPLYLKWIERLISRADAVTLHTQFLQSRFGGSYVANGKDMDLFDPSRYDADQSRARYNLSNYKVLMFPGAPRPYKGVEDILQALEILNRSDYRLVIVGGSPYDHYDDDLFQKWGKWLIKLPKAPYEQMPEIVSAAHVIVVPQRDTPAAQAQFPLKLTDGMAMAKPVLATRVGDIPKILGNTGYLADSESPEQLAEQLSHIFQDLAAANQKGHQARARCADHYSITTMANQLQQVLAGLNL
ncbi:MAG: Glycosyltransferase [Phormidesmis priestleyi Ana]|uniref:Glycosyltransferase n=1 Tax=Phormidesmis priestleyi Ana TaxID=1666911 RepID=A0A0N8KMP0_9CYAN|nr:MAG: Glycosyltransferase [Phormidesmis priestleyi Ana]